MKRTGFVIGFVLGIAVVSAYLVAILQSLGPPSESVEIVYCIVEIIGGGLVAGLLGATIEAMVSRRG